MDVRAMYKFQSGLYVVSAQAGEDVGACIINTGLQLTSDPLQVQVVVNKQNHTEGVIAKATSADYDKFDGIESVSTVLGDPYTPECAACMLACKVVGSLDVGTHTIFVGEVVDAKVLSDDAPMTYAYYHTVLKGKTPAKASSFVKE